VSFTVNETIAAPIYFYYQLDNFYQNHRRYVKSRSYSQLQGTYLTAAKIATDCDPIVYMNSTGRTKYVDTTVKYNGSSPAIPCGLVAKSVFNDTYELTNSSDSSKVYINESNIAWESDVKYKFHNIDLTTLPAGSTVTNWTQIQWQDMEDGKITYIF